MFSGFIFVDDLFAQDLSRKTILSCLSWIVFAILLFGRWRFGWRGRTAVRWTLSGFALLGLAYFGSRGRARIHPGPSLGLSRTVTWLDVCDVRAIHGIRPIMSPVA